MSEGVLLFRAVFIPYLLRLLTSSFAPFCSHFISHLHCLAASIFHSLAPLRHWLSHLLVDLVVDPYLLLITYSFLFTGPIITLLLLLLLLLLISLSLLPYLASASFSAHTVSSRHSISKLLQPLLRTTLGKERRSSARTGLLQPPFWSYPNLRRSFLLGKIRLSLFSGPGPFVLLLLFFALSSLGCLHMALRSPFSFSSQRLVLFLFSSYLVITRFPIVYRTYLLHFSSPYLSIPHFFLPRPHPPSGSRPRSSTASSPPISSFLRPHSPYSLSFSHFLAAFRVPTFTLFPGPPDLRNDPAHADAPPASSTSQLHG